MVIACHGWGCGGANRAKVMQSCSQLVMGKLRLESWHYRGNQGHVISAIHGSIPGQSDYTC